MKLISRGHYHAEAVEPLPTLKPLVEESTGQSIRRIGRFIQLALIGAGRCARAVDDLPQDTAVYLSSGAGDVAITLDVMAQLYRQHQPPKPLSFINTVSNSACFYIARTLGLEGRSQFVSSRRGALASALQLAELDLLTDQVPAALVGSVDVAVPPLTEHRERLRQPPDQRLGEGSHWFLLTPDTHPAPALARYHGSRTFTEAASLIAWVRDSGPTADTVLLAGPHLATATRDALVRDLGLAGAQSLPPDTPWYESLAGFQYQDFLVRTDATAALHVDADRTGRLTAALWSR